MSIAAFQAVDPGSIPGQRNQSSLHVDVVLCNILTESDVVMRTLFAMPDANLKVRCFWKNDGQVLDVEHFNSVLSKCRNHLFM